LKIFISDFLIFKKFNYTTCMYWMKMPSLKMTGVLYRSLSPFFQSSSFFLKQTLRLFSLNLHHSWWLTQQPLTCEVMKHGSVLRAIERWNSIMLKREGIWDLGMTYEYACLSFKWILSSRLSSSSQSAQTETADFSAIFCSSHSEEYPKHILLVLSESSPSSNRSTERVGWVPSIQ